MSNIWFTADTHFHHKNICRGVTEWKENEGEQKTRDFTTLEEMDEALIVGINGLVKGEDVLYHLGDWSFGGHEQIRIFRERIECKTIHLVFGNHDQHIEPINSQYRQLFSTVQYTKEFSLKLGTERINKMGKQLFFLSHYSHQVWNKSHHGAIHLFGHSHGTIQGIGRSMDVGVDTNNYYPYHLDEIVSKLAYKDVHIIDHHNSNTN